jgi:hypothetical protein
VKPETLDQDENDFVKNANKKDESIRLQTQKVSRFQQIEGEFELVDLEPKINFNQNLKSIKTKNFSNRFRM